MTQIRVARMAEQLRVQISDIFRTHLSDPRLAWISVVRVDLSPDLRHATVFVSTLGEEAAQEACFRVVHRAAGAVRAELSRRLRVRRVPEILFRADRSIAYSLRVQSILSELGLDDETGAGSGAPDEDLE